MDPAAHPRGPAGGNSGSWPRGAVTRRGGRRRSSNTVRPPKAGASVRSRAIVGRDVGAWIGGLLDASGERIEPAQAVELVGAADLGRVERAAQHADRLVVDVQRHRERMPVLAAVREGEAGRVVEAGRRAVHDLGNQRQRLQRPRPELFDQQQRGEVAQVALVGQGQHRAEPSRVDVAGPDVVMCRHLQPADGGHRACRDRLRRWPAAPAGREPPGDRRGSGSGRPGCRRSRCAARR